MNSARVFVRLRDGYSVSDVSELIRNLEGSINGESANHIGLIAEIPKENIDQVREHSAILRVYDGKIPESTVRGYDPALKFLAGIHNRSFNQQPTPATPEEAQRLREAMYRGALKGSITR